MGIENIRKNIKWNEVTWYSKIIAILLGAFIFAVGGYLGMAYQTMNDTTYKNLLASSEFVPLTTQTSGMVQCGIMRKSPTTPHELMMSTFAQKCMQNALSSCYPASALYSDGIADTKTIKQFVISSDNSFAKCSIWGWQSTQSSPMAYTCSGIVPKANGSFVIDGCGKYGDFVFNNTVSKNS